MSKKQLILNLFFAGGIASVSAQDGSVNEADLMGIGILPDSIPVLDGAEADSNKRPITPSENNPFSEREMDAPQVAIQTESEEMKIKKLIDDMPVHGGLMKRAGGPKVLLGDLILQKGSLVPQLLPNQTEQLVVRELDEEKIELAFLETPEYKGQPRAITKLMDIRPTVGHVLSGGNDDYLVERGRDEMAAEEQLAAVLASRASGGSIGTTIPGITVNGKTAKRESKSALSSLLRNYGPPGAGGITGNSTAGAADTMGRGGNGAAAVEQASPDNSQPFDFGGFQMSPAEAAQGAADASTPSSSGSSPASTPRAGGSQMPRKSTAAPSFTN